MDEMNNQPGFVPPVGGPGNVNPTPPSFMGNVGGPEIPPPPMPSNPPVGGALGGYATLPAPPMPNIAPVMGSPVAPPPPKQVDIRTMASDQSSFRASGGTGVTPQTMKPMGNAPRKVDSAGKPVGGDKKKALFIGLGIVVFLGAAAAVANFFVLPIFLSDTQLSEPPVVTTEDGVTEEPEVTPTIPTFTHVSYFTAPVDVSAEVNVSSLSLENLNSALDQTASSKADGEAGVVTEFEVTQGLTGSPVTTDEFLSTLLPDVQFTVAMEEDFTGFMYDTGTEVRAGYILALDSETVDLEAAKTLFKDTFEASTSLENLFLNDPGTPAATVFKDGSAVAGVKTRWLAYSNAATSIDYGWKGPFVIISTSFDAFKKVVPSVMSALPVAEVVETDTEAEVTATTTET